jgi:hypothetical protein
MAKGRASGTVGIATFSLTRCIIHHILSRWILGIQDPRLRPAPIVPPPLVFGCFLDPPLGSSRFAGTCLRHIGGVEIPWIRRLRMFLSLISTDHAEVRHQNDFAWMGYSYLLLSFKQLAATLQRLHPHDRFFCYVIPSGVPVHMYLDLDGNYGDFPHLVNEAEACLNEFLREVRTLFQELFRTEMDCSRMTFPEAS